MLYQVPRPREKVGQKVIELCSFQNFQGKKRKLFICLVLFLGSPDHLSLCVHFYFTFFVRLYFNTALSLKIWVRFDVGHIHDSGILHFASPINGSTIESAIY